MFCDWSGDRSFYGIAKVIYLTSCFTARNFRLDAAAHSCSFLRQICGVKNIQVAVFIQLHLEN